MGTTHVEVCIANVADESRSVELEMIVDTGAYFSIVPAPLLRRIGIEPYHTRHTFWLANGRSVVRDVGAAMFTAGKHKGVAPVIFGRPKDAPLLGVITIEAMGFEIDPLQHAIRAVRKPLLALRGRGNLRLASRVGT
jgi:predicted aspartyl protease